MGKRRDRRHAVLGGGGRRMKLDLSNDDEVATAEEMNVSISTTVEEGGEKIGVKSEERLSPHSLPGPVQVNPLSLLGQYSDEDEEEENAPANGSSGGVPTVAVAGQVDEQVATFLADLETSGLLKDDIAHHEDEAEPEGAKQATLPQEVNTKKMEILFEWEAVMHKETSEYYYWNKVTGETTWEKPAAYAAYESKLLRKGNIQVEPKEDSEHPLEDPNPGSNPALEVFSQEPVSTINTAVLQEAKNDTASEERDFVESDQLKGLKSEAMSVGHVGKQGAGNSDDGKQSDICLESNGGEIVDSSLGNLVKGNPEIVRDLEVTSSAAVVERVSGGSGQVEASITLNTVENGESAEDHAAESNIPGFIEDHPTAVDRADATGSENSDPKIIPEQLKRYDYHRMLERGEVLASKFRTLAGGALRGLSLKIRLAIESDIRLSDCKAMALCNFAEDRFWEHMDSQITRLEAMLLVEEATSSLEAEQQLFTSSVAAENHQSRPESDDHGAQGFRQQPSANVEEIFKSTTELRSEDEDMDVDMDLDMEAEDENVVSPSAAARSVDHDALGALPVHQATVPQSLVYISTQTLPPLDSYGHVESQPPPRSLHSLPETPLFPSAPLFPNVDPVFPAVLSSFPLPPADSWVPPPPPEEEWAPPPLPDQEAPPPPPDEDDLPPASALDSSTLDTPSSTPLGPLADYYSVGTDQPTHDIIGGRRQDVDSSGFSAADVDTASVHVNGNASVSTGVAETTTKKSNKVRNKKRSHSAAVGASLMSNKKVSSLVNKWLAAQEELHSSDEDEEDKDLFDVEALEKKRQKEIDEWRHQTLASGGALENANFQPLGTLDWRERVKRAKKEASKLAAKQEKVTKPEELKKDLTHASEESSLDADRVVASGTPPKRPDLKELNKDLPSGWQAFWDAESSEVYYGNLATSETSWDRPV